MALNFTCHVIAQSLNFVRFCCSWQSPLILFILNSFVLSANFPTPLGQSSFMEVLWKNMLKDTRTDTCRSAVVVQEPTFHAVNYLSIPRYYLLLHGCWNSFKSPSGNSGSLQQLTYIFPYSSKTNWKWDISLQQACILSRRLYLPHVQELDPSQ